MKKWMTKREILEAGLPGWPRSKPGLQIRAEKLGLETRRRGNKIQYKMDISYDDESAEAIVSHAGQISKSKKAQTIGVWRGKAIDRVAALAKSDGFMVAYSQVAREIGVSAGTLRRWRGLVLGYDRKDWPTVLSPAPIPGRPPKNTTDEAAMSYIMLDYLRPEKPSFRGCYERLIAVAANEGWQVATLPTLKRQFFKEVPQLVITRMRERPYTKNKSGYVQTILP